MAHDVFISYSIGDKPTADAIANALETRGIRGWIAPRDVLPGEEWGPAIVRAIEQARVMVLVFSSHANASRQVRREVQLAFENDLTVIPFRVEDVQATEALKYYIQPVHWLDALTPPLARHIRFLTDRIQSYLDAVSGGHPSPVDDPAPSPPPRQVASTIAPAPVPEPSHHEAREELAHAKRAGPLDPKSSVAYLFRGTDKAKGELDKAIADYTEAIHLSPKSAFVYVSRGIAYEDKGELDKAIADYTEAIRLDPKHAATTFFCRGKACKKKGELDKAIADYTEAIRLKRSYASAYWSRGSAYSDQGELDKAIADYTEAIRLDPKDAFLHTGRATCYLRKSDVERASADIEEAIRLNPNFGSAYEVRSKVFEKRGQADKAEADRKKAAELSGKKD